jgi:diphosphomevalonate decarboxylase
MNVAWKSPSNIALVKYWGKKPVQLPCNPSISFSLAKSFSQVNIKKILKKKSLITSFKFTDDYTEKSGVEFSNRFEEVLNLWSKSLSVINKYSFEITSYNSFPHSAGIASSASSMSALALCMLELEYLEEDKDWSKHKDKFFKEASFYARLASGSASRSVYCGFVSWGKSESVMQSSDEFANTISVSEKFHDICDSILIVDSKVKKVSSSVGHELMNKHVFADSRFNQAKDHYNKLLGHLNSGDWQKFGELIELEALTLHGLMMSSETPYVLLHVNSLALIDKIKEYRFKNKLDMYFTIDAGPNIHLIYPKKNFDKVQEFIQENLNLLENNRFINDEIGMGPESLLANV